MSAGRGGAEQDGRAGQGAHDLESPAPTMTLTAAEGDGHGHGAGEADDAAAGSVSNKAAGDSGDESDEEGNGLSIAALVLGALGLLAGGAALARTRSTS